MFDIPDVVHKCLQLEYFATIKNLIKILPISLEQSFGPDITLELRFLSPALFLCYITILSQDSKNF